MPESVVLDRDTGLSFPKLDVPLYNERRARIHLVKSPGNKSEGLEVLVTPLSYPFNDISPERIRYLRVTPTTRYGREFSEATIGYVNSRRPYVRLTDHETGKRYILKSEPDFPNKVIPETRVNQLDGMGSDVSIVLENEEQENPATELYEWLCGEFSDSLGKESKVKRRNLKLTDITRPFLTAHVSQGVIDSIVKLAQTYNRGITGSLQDFLGPNFARYGFLNPSDRLDATTKGVHSLLLKGAVNGLALLYLAKHPATSDFFLTDILTQAYLADMGLSTLNGVINSFRYKTFATPGIIGTIRTKDTHQFSDKV